MPAQPARSLGTAASLTSKQAGSRAGREGRAGRWVGGCELFGLGRWLPAGCVAGCCWHRRVLGVWASRAWESGRLHACELSPASCTAASCLSSRRAVQVGREAHLHALLRLPAPFSCSAGHTRPAGLTGRYLGRTVGPPSWGGCLLGDLAAPQVIEGWHCPLERGRTFGCPLQGAASRPAPWCCRQAGGRLQAWRGAAGGLGRPEVAWALLPAGRQAGSCAGRV